MQRFETIYHTEIPGATASREWDETGTVAVSLCKALRVSNKPWQVKVIKDGRCFSYWYDCREKAVNHYLNEVRFCMEKAEYNRTH